MSDVQGRLIECFATVFPQLPRESIPAASRENVEWDSLAMVTLTALIEEEFGIVVTADNLANFVAFDAALLYLEAELAPR